MPINWDCVFQYEIGEKVMSTSASTFDTLEPNIGELLANIRTGKIQLPDFQRRWVWEDNRIRSIIASVSMSYPVGAIMTMEVKSSYSS
jgi:uncharacterized protein with ParB-like and HNH nuclease domain